MWNSMITIAVFALIIFHPGFGFQNKFNNLEYESVSTIEQSGASKEGISLMTVEQHQRST
jgi:hypothetical protein